MLPYNMLIFLLYIRKAKFIFSADFFRNFPQHQNNSIVIVIWIFLQRKSLGWAEFEPKTHLDIWTWELVWCKHATVSSRTVLTPPTALHRDKYVQGKVPELKQWQATWAKSAVDRKTASRICPLRLAMGTPLFQFSYHFNSGTLSRSSKEWRKQQWTHSAYLSKSAAVSFIIFREKLF